VTGADAVAAELVATSQARYSEDAQRSLKALKAQLDLPDPRETNSIQR